MKWSQCQLGDALTLQRGFDLPNGSRTAGSIPVVSSAGRTGTHDVAKVSGPGVVIGRYGTLGEVHYVIEDFWPLNTTLWVKEFKGNLPLFCAYLLRTLAIAETSGAAAVPGVNRNVLHALPINLPPLETQRRIASILGAYDDLIEVNRRRAAVLEEIARGLFEEWFVRFRFPGHENVPMIDTAEGPLPEGWTVGPLREVAQLRSGFPFKSGTFAEGGHFSIVTIKHVHDGRLSPPFLSQIDHLPAKMPKYCIIEQGDILLSLTGNVGRSCLAWGTNLLLNQRVAKVECQLSEHKALVYQWLRSPNIIKRLQLLSNGVAQQNLSPVQTMAMPFQVPPRHIADRFEATVGPMLDQIVGMQRASATLAAARDLLLPRLISGQLPVKAAERELEEAA